MARNGATGPFGQSRQSGKEINIVEPELGVGFIPRVPAQQADRQRRCHLHVGRSATGKADDPDARHSDQRRIQVPARTESSHVQVDEADHDEGEGGGRKTRAPVVNAEVLKQKHGAPVIESWLLKPGTAIKIGSDAGSEPVFNRVRGVEPHQHLVRDLRVAGFVSAHQPNAVATQHRGETVKEKEDRENKKDGNFADRSPLRQPLPGILLQIQSRSIQFSFHFRQFSRCSERHRKASNHPPIRRSCTVAVSYGKSHCAGVPPRMAILVLL